MLTQRRRATVLLAVIWTVSACAPTRPVQSPPTPLPPKPLPEIIGAAAQPAPAGAVVYALDPARSRLEARVYRAGPLARLGHNHVVTAGGATGRAWVGATPADSGFEVVVPVASLVVDDPAARAAAGPDFAGEVPESAREGTRANMTRPEVLDVAAYPTVTLRCTGLLGDWSAPRAPVDVTLRGVTRRIEVPVAIERSAATLTARGEFMLRQTDFGITPFSVAGGAIQVADEVVLSFDAVAVAVAR